jgi:hypothetical protein
LKHDQLLTYLSEKGHGGWDTLREAWHWLLGDERDPADKAWIASQELSSLGHIEVAWADEISWCAAPPVLTMIPRSGGRALLTGGRTRTLYEPALQHGQPGSGRVFESADALGLWIDEWPSRAGPTTVMVACESATDAERLADRLGIAYTYSVADQLSQMLPPLAAYSRLWRAGELPRGFDAERFDTESLRWQAAETTERYGIYRCRTWQSHVHATYSPTGWYRVPREQGIYEVLRWDNKRVLSYNEAALQLSVPVHARLPILHARAAILCTGRLPRFSTAGCRPTLRYPNVSPDIAERIASALCQPLE